MSFKFLQLNQRGYSNRTSVLSYSPYFTYKITHPSQNYPSAAPYSALTKFFCKLIKERVIHNRLLKQLLYPEYLNKMNLNLVKIRHHKSECVIMTRSLGCRFSIVKCDSDSDSESDSEHERISRQNASSSDSSSSSNPFGYIRYYNPQTGSHAEIETKYESFIDYGELPLSSEAQMVKKEEDKKSSVLITSTARLQLVHQTSESSDASSLLMPKPPTAFEDLRNIDEDIPISSFNLPKVYVPTARQSLPTKFVGDKFCESSLTTIDIPQWQSNSDNYLNCRSKFSISKSEVQESSSCATTTHSSSLDLNVNTLPLPDNIVAELLYNFDDTGTSDNVEFAKSESVDSDRSEKSFRTVIKPSAVFQDDAHVKNQHVAETMSLNLDNIGFRKHSINSDKPRRRSSIQLGPTRENQGIRRCVSSHFMQLNSRGHGCSDTACCMETCQSPRSSDSGMAGSCTLNSPDFGGNDQEHCSADMTNVDLFGSSSHQILSLSEIEARDFNSQCPCTSPFGSTPRTSCQTSIAENIIIGSHDSMRTTSVTSLDISLSQPWEWEPKVHSKIANINPAVLKTEPPRCVGNWEPIKRSKSLECASDKPNISCNVDDAEEKEAVYKSGLYAHWWLKAKIPASVVKGIYEDTRSPTTGKGVCVL